MKKAFVAVKHIYFMGRKIHKGRTVSLHFLHNGLPEARVVISKVDPEKRSIELDSIFADEYGMSPEGLFEHLERKNVLGPTRTQMILFFLGLGAAVAALICAILFYS